MEYKTFTAEIKASDDSTDDIGVFEGYANTFDNLDLVDDIVHKGSFKKTLKESKRRGLFFMHNTRDINNLIGEAVSLKEDDTGLKMRGEIDLTDPMGAKAFKFIKRGTISEMSIGFQILKAEFEQIKDKYVRHIKELKLFEISVIPMGMAANPASLITGVKSIDDIYKIVKDKQNDDEFLKKVFSLFDRKPDELITLIKSINPDTAIEEPIVLDLEEHYRTIQNILRR